MAQRSSSRINPLTICLVVVGIALLVVGIVFFVEPGHHIRRGLLAIVLAAACGIGAVYVQRRTKHGASAIASNEASPQGPPG